MRKLAAGDIDRMAVLARDNYICQICGEPALKPLHRKTDMRPRRATVDHIVPLSKGGTNHPSNLQCAHKECNEKKGDTHD